MFTLEATSQDRRQCCDSVLQTAPEYESSEGFLRCVSRGAKNLFVLSLSFIGWRTSQGMISVEDFDGNYSKPRQVSNSWFQFQGYERVPSNGLHRLCPPFRAGGVFSKAAAD